jgi:hypothetical protein
MKALAITCGVVFVIALAVAGGIGYMIYQGIRLDSSAREYAEANVPPILSTWSKDELTKRASPEMRDEIAKDPTVLDGLFKKCATFGALESREIVKHDAHVSVTTEEGKVITATCVFDAKFKNGNAKIAVQLIEHAGQWQILSFHVDSPALLK